VDRRREAGVCVDHKNYDGVTHEFFGMGAVVDKAKQAVQQAADGLKSGFGQSK
jgi:acetyl esterase